MSEPRELVFQRDGELPSLLPPQCSIDVSCYEQREIQCLIAKTVQRILESLAQTGTDLRALDGVTLTSDCAAASVAIQTLPEGQRPSEIGDQPDTMEMARTVPVWRGKELRFHVVMRAGLGVGLVCDDPAMEAVALACIAHEAAHVEHEGHLYRTFPHVYGRQIPCGHRSPKMFLKAMDVWSEYAASRSSAMFRPEAAEEFEQVFCRALEDSLTVCKKQIATCRESGDARSVFKDMEGLVGDAYVCAGYFLGHLDGTGLEFDGHAHRASELTSQFPGVGDLLRRLHVTLHELWVSKLRWCSLEVFSPIYDILCAMMAHHGLAFAKGDTDWRITVDERIEAQQQPGRLSR